MPHPFVDPPPLEGVWHALPYQELADQKTGQAVVLGCENLKDVMGGGGGGVVSTN